MKAFVQKLAAIGASVVVSVIIEVTNNVIDIQSWQDSELF